MKIKNYKVKD